MQFSIFSGDLGRWVAEGSPGSNRLDGTMGPPGTDQRELFGGGGLQEKTTWR